MTIRDEYIKETYKLSIISHEAWTLFMVAFNKYVIELTEEAVKASPDTALVAHGRAQAVLKLREDFNKIDELYKKVVKA